MPDVHTFAYSPETGPRSPAIHLDVHLPSSSPTAQPLRTLIWFHGGGLLQGARQNIAPHMLNSVDRENIALISIDYRHTPQVRVPDIQSDVAKAYNYVLHTLPKLLADKTASATNLDLENLVVTGSSAGGWLALMLSLGMLESVGVREEDRKKIRGVAVLYPITDAGDKWWDGPREPMIKPLWPDEIYEKMSDPDSPAESNTKGTPQTNPRTQFYHYAHKKGTFRSLLFSESQLSSGWLEKSAVSSFIRSNASHKASTWPNVYLNHGDIDTAVPPTQSKDVFDALKQGGFTKTLVYDGVKGKSHMYDQFDENEALDSLWEFVRAQWQS